MTAAAVFILAACNRNQTQAPSTPTAQAPSATPAPAAPQPPPPAPIPAATELPVNSVDSVMLSRPQDEPMTLVIRVSGSVASTGWTNAKLTEEPATEDASVKTYKFVATSPEMPDENRAPQQMEAELQIASLPAEVKTIRIVSATNEISAPVAQ